MNLILHIEKELEDKRIGHCVRFASTRKQIQRVPEVVRNGYLYRAGEDTGGSYSFTFICTGMATT